jgi:hypothetical protein
VRSSYRERVQFCNVTFLAEKMEKNLKLSLSNDAKNSRKNGCINRIEARDFGVSVEIVKPRKDYHLIYENVGRELTLIDTESEIFFAFLSRRLRVRVVGWLIRSEQEKRARDMSQRVISIA